MAADAGGVRLHALRSMYVSRVIHDLQGVRWHVYEVAPIAPTPTLEPLRERHERRRHWLAFESDSGELRGLVPMPDEWPRCDDAVIVALLERAAVLDPESLQRATDPRPLAADAPPRATDPHPRI